VGTLYSIRQGIPWNVKAFLSIGMDFVNIMGGGAVPGAPGPREADFAGTPVPRILFDRTASEEYIFQQIGGVAQLVRACGSYPQRPGFESLHRHQISLMSSAWGGEEIMRKIVIWATAGLFALSLQGTALAQKEEKAPEIMPPAMESPAPVTPAEKAPAIEKSTSKKKTQKKKTQKTCKKPVKKKRCKPAKKVA
jgi:hypothetical protein